MRSMERGAAGIQQEKYSFQAGEKTPQKNPAGHKCTIEIKMHKGIRHGEREGLELRKYGKEAHIIKRTNTFCSKKNIMKNIIKYVCHEIFNQIKKTLQEN